MPPRQAEDISESGHGFDDDTQSIDFLIHDDEEESGNCGRAIVKEFKRTVGTHWVQEMTNFNQKTIAVSFFIFFAAVAPAVTFGAVCKSTVFSSLLFVFPVIQILMAVTMSISDSLVSEPKASTIM